MQAKNHSFSQFFLRTDLLAEHYHVPVESVAEKIGISTTMLFSFRKGRYAISAKAWRKLEKAEKEAGIYKKSEDSEILEDRAQEEWKF